MSKIEIGIVAVIIVVILLVLVVTVVKSCDLYPEPTDGMITKYKHEYLPVIANALLPTPAPTQNPFPTITYPPPVTPVP